MAHLSLLLLLLFLVCLQRITSSENCSASSCGGQTIRFPFCLNGQSDYRCGYPGFDLSCSNRNQPIIKLPLSGEFTVQYIEYWFQTISINDPDSCNPRRFLNFNLSGSPFQPLYVGNFTYLNCSSDAQILHELSTIPCLRGDNYTILTIDTADYNTVDPALFGSCSVISAAVSVPLPSQFSSNLTEPIQLTWTEPNCKSCELQAGTCHFQGDTGLEITCSYNDTTVVLPSHNSNNRFLFFIGIPMMFVLMLIFHILVGGCRQTSNNPNHPPITEISIPITQEPVLLKGLDEPTIESFPKTSVDESGRLPNPNCGNTCPICLSDYQPKEMLRTIPDCNHYFHADCLDPWLRKNPSCPVCRSLQRLALLSNITP